jgi:hypothetical protein
MNQTQLNACDANATMRAMSLLNALNTCVLMACTMAGPDGGAPPCASALAACRADTP